jgi:hypothetical protein
LRAPRLEDEHTGALAHDEPVAVDAPGRGRLGVVVALGQRLHRGERRDGDGWITDSVPPAIDVGEAVAQVLDGVDDRLGAGGAGAGDRAA